MRWVFLVSIVLMVGAVFIFVGLGAYWLWFVAPTDLTGRLLTTAVVFAAVGFVGFMVATT